jgi:hypothetical protein
MKLYWHPAMQVMYKVVLVYDRALPVIPLKFTGVPVTQSEKIILM